MMSHKPAIGIGIAVATAVLGLVSLASDSARTEKPAAVDAQEMIGLVHAQFSKEHGRHVGVEVLAGVHQHLGQA